MLGEGVVEGDVSGVGFVEGECVVVIEEVYDSVGYLFFVGVVGVDDGLFYMEWWVFENWFCM